MPAIIIDQSADGTYRVAITQPDEAALSTADSYPDLESAMDAGRALLEGGGDSELSADTDAMVAGSTADPGAGALAGPAKVGPQSQMDAMADGFKSTRGDPEAMRRIAMGR